MNLELFTKAIEQIKSNVEIDRKIDELFKVEGITTFFCDTNDMISQLLADAMQDSGEWIEYFMWELDFGERAKELSAFRTDGSNIPLNTIEELYNFLEEEKIND